MDEIRIIEVKQGVFEENNNMANSGANGAEVTIGGEVMYVYGEFKIEATELFIYIDKN